MIEKFYITPRGEQTLQVILIRVRVDLRVMVIEGYSTFLELQNWSLTIRYILGLYPRHKKDELLEI